MGRIKAAPKPGLFGRIAYFLARRRFGQVPESLTIWAHDPPLLFRACAFEAASDRFRAVDAPLRHLVELRVATLVGCPF